MFVLRLWWYLHRFWSTRWSGNHTLEYIMSTVLYFQLVYLLSSVFCLCFIISFQLYTVNYVPGSSSFFHSPFVSCFFFFCCCCCFLFFEFFYTIFTQRILGILRQTLSVPESDHNKKNTKLISNWKYFNSFHICTENNDAQLNSSK